MSQKRKLVALIAGLSLVLLGFSLGRLTDSRQEKLPGILGQGSQISSISPTPVSQVSQASPDLLLVTRVIDGDTIEVENGERIRYIGIDTPETVDPRKPVQCFGKEATEKNKELVEGKQVRLEKDITDRDRYNRLLRYVYVADTPKRSELFVNFELVKQGFAYSYTYPPDVAHQSEFIAAQEEAQEAGRGLWSTCPLSSPTPLPSLSILSPSSPQSAGCLIKGNIGSTGEKIYHLPGCGSYEKTKIDESRGERWFCSEDDAVSAGWRKAKNC